MVLIFWYGVFFGLCTMVIGNIWLCCPNGQRLISTSLKMSRSERFSCVESNLSTTVNTSTVNNYDLTSEVQKRISGYGIFESYSVRIPECEHVHLLNLTDGYTFLSAETCVDAVDGNYYAISCPAPSFNLIELSIVKKCCPLNYLYNETARSCQQSLSIFDRFSHIFHQPVIFEMDKFVCESPKVIVEYFSSKIPIRSEYGKIIVDNKEKFDTDEYCIESVMNENKKIISHNGRIKNTEDFIDNKYMIRTCQHEFICNKIPCLRRCCSDQQKYLVRNKTKHCVDYPGKSMHVDFHNTKFNDSGLIHFYSQQPEAFGIISHQPCQKYVLESVEQDTHYFHYKNGSLIMPIVNQHYHKDIYCVEYAEEDSYITRRTYVCFDDPGRQQRVLYSIGTSLSTFFLILTFITYILLKKLRNLPGKILLFQISSMIPSMIILTLFHFALIEECGIWGFVMYFCFTSTFCWLNVMCFDIWWTFGHLCRSLERSQQQNSSRQNRRLIYYCLYAYSVASLLTLITVLCDNFIYDGHTLHESKCWFQNGSQSQILLFIIPEGLILLGNLVLFILTMKYCNNVKYEINRLQANNPEAKNLKKTFTIDKKTFIMNIKMCTVMGIPWILEILSSLLYNYQNIITMIDVMTICQGIFIFLIFVFKRTVYHEFRKLFGMKISPQGSGRPTATTTLSSSTNDLRRGRITSDGNQTLLRPSVSPQFEKRLPPLS